MAVWFSVFASASFLVLLQFALPAGRACDHGRLRWAGLHLHLLQAGLEAVSHERHGGGHYRAPKKGTLLVQVAL